jgi:hypothetical protein
MNCVSISPGARLKRRFTIRSDCTSKNVLIILITSAATSPESERAARETLALPVYPEISSEAQSYVVNSIAEFFRYKIICASAQVGRGQISCGA